MGNDAGCRLCRWIKEYRDKVDLSSMELQALLDAELSHRQKFHTRGGTCGTNV